MNFKEYIRPGRGASDITPLLLNGAVFAQLVDALAESFGGVTIDKIACIEAKGFILGAALAYKLQVGLVPLRKQGMLKNDSYSASFKDYTGKEKVLEVQIDAINSGENILIIDDWVETGGAVKAAIELIEKLKGNVVGIGTLMDDSHDDLKRELSKYNYRYIEKALPSDNL